MEYTIIGSFNTTQQALAARASLIASGFGDTEIRIQDNSEPSPQLTFSQGDTPEDYFDGSEDYLSALFNPEQESERQGNNEPYRSAALVAVSVADARDASLAGQALEELGAVDVEQHATTWREPQEQHAHQQGAAD